MEWKNCQTLQAITFANSQSQSCNLKQIHEISSARFISFSPWFKIMSVLDNANALSQSNISNDRITNNLQLQKQRATTSK